MLPSPAMAAAGVLLLLLLLAAVSLSTAQIFLPVCGTSGNFTTNSTYASNLAAAAAAVTANASAPGGDLFATAAAGRVYALAMCQRDTNSSSCSACLTRGFSDAQKSCPFTMGATVYYDYCLLSYSSADFLAGNGSNGEKPQGLLSEVNVVPSLVARFTRLVGALMNATADYAAFNTTNRFAVSELQGFDYPIYGLAQCSPDLSPAACRACLAGEIAYFPRWFGQGTQGGRVLSVRCVVRFEIYGFYFAKAMLVATPATFGDPASVASPAPEPTTPGKSSDIGVILAVAIPVATALLVIAALCVCFCRKRKNKQTELLYSATSHNISNEEPLLVDLATLQAATENFADHNKIGQGGFGSVYKGVLEDGQHVAVKRLSQSSGQGIDELRNELVLVAKLQHKNLVRLLGVCVVEQEKMIVYEYIPNGSLDSILFDPEKRGLLTWSKRYGIINGIARGLQYLHEESQLKIIHRDLKASNILLDAEMSPKISDFGLARLFGGEQTHSVTNRVVGTFGYMAPEYAMRGQYSIKSDVFSFGVLVLEIVTGKQNSGSSDSASDDLLSLVWEHWESSTVPEIIDPSVSGNCSLNEVLRCLHIGLLCVQENPTSRPTMSTVGVMLSNETVSLRTPSIPAFCMLSGNAVAEEHSRGNGAFVSERSEIMTSTMNNVSITQIEPR